MGNNCKPSSSKSANDCPNSGTSTSDLGNKMTIDEYRQKVDQARELYNSGPQASYNIKTCNHDEKYDHGVEYFNHYDQLVDCLSLNHSKIGLLYCGNSQIGIISQLIQQYSGNYYIRLVCTINRQDPILSQYDIEHISSIINPVNSDIYMTDTVSIYKISSFATNMYNCNDDNIGINYSNQQVCQIYSIVNSKGKRNKNHKNHMHIQNLAINSCGQRLFFQAGNFYHIPISSKVEHGKQQLQQQQKSANKFQNVKPKLLDNINKSNVVQKTQLNWDMNPNGLRHGPCMTNYICDEYRGIRWQIIDTSESNEMKKLVKITASYTKISYGVTNWYNVDIDLLLDKYHICNNKNDKIIHLSKIIKDYCEKNCTLKQHDSGSLIQLFGMSRFDYIKNKKEAWENLSKYKFQCSCGDFASEIVAFTMDFYSNCFYILLKNEKLYKIENTRNTNVNNNSSSDWRIISRVNLRQPWYKKEAIWDWNRVSMCYDSIFQRLIVSDRDNVRMFYTF